MSFKEQLLKQKQKQDKALTPDTKSDSIKNDAPGHISTNLEVAADLNPAAKRELRNVVSGGFLDRIQVSDIDLSPYQPRIITDNVLEIIKTLAHDISINGQLTPITVRQKGTRFELIGGERRFRAIKDILGLESITAFVKANITDEKAAIQALSDNTNRENLTDYENIIKIKQICDEFGFPFHSQEFVTEKFSLDKSRYFRLKYILDLPDFMLDSLSIEPELISGYIAQEVKTLITKNLEFRTESEVHEILRLTWATYVSEFMETRKRHKGFLSELAIFQTPKAEKPHASSAEKKNDEPTDEDTESNETDKIEFKTANGVKFGSMRKAKGLQGKNVLNLRITIESELDEEKTRKIEEFFRNL